MKPWIPKIDWVNVAFLTVTPAVALTPILAGWISLTSIHPVLWAVTIFLYLSASIGITGGYHRLFAHKGYEANRWVRLFYLVFAAATVENSALRWCTDHRRHHRHVDTDQDPYNAKRGFFYSHMGWVMLKQNPEYQQPKWKFPDLENDPLIQWQHRNYLSLVILVGFLFPMGVGALFGQAWEGLIVGGFLRTVFTHHCTFLVNSACHIWGKLTFSDECTARDSAILAFFTFGEGYHNFHHKFQWDYRNGIRWFHWDPTKWLVGVFHRLGWVKDLKRATPKQILQSRLLMEEKQLIQHGYWSENFEKLKHQCLQAQETFRQRLEEYRRERKVVQQARRVEMRKQVREARREFARVYSEWRSMIRAMQTAPAAGAM